MILRNIEALLAVDNIWSSQFREEDLKKGRTGDGQQITEDYPEEQRRTITREY